MESIVKNNAKEILDELGKDEESYSLSSEESRKVDSEIREEMGKHICVDWVVA